MSDLTPLEALDDAIRTFVDTLDDTQAGEFMSGWVLSWQQTKVTSDPGLLPLASANDYTLSPSTTLELAIGLTRAMGMKLDSELFGDDDER